ncbi:DUF6461 domain-containing protein [Streptomyces virginiae]|uniref:DUF6461 domain-containing protein n=1 Tax=Streptomyces virginiae TaxID=1961 RepID=UPI0036C0081D
MRSTRRPPGRPSGTTRIGFHVDDDAPETGTDLSSPAAFALAEHLTGVAITPEPLQKTRSRARPSPPTGTSRQGDGESPVTLGE